MFKSLSAVELVYLIKWGTSSRLLTFMFDRYWQTLTTQNTKAFSKALQTSVLSAVIFKEGQNNILRCVMPTLMVPWELATGRDGSRAKGYGNYSDGAKPLTFQLSDITSLCPASWCRTTVPILWGAEFSVLSPCPYLDQRESGLNHHTLSLEERGCHVAICHFDHFMIYWHCHCIRKSSPKLVQVATVGHIVECSFQTF